ncbi:hypothetical protein PTSG_01103 [Salpingoeca rosetta]|uniref:Small acidic protein n=1 Tax=Salpingoeca rosetta (strain ATCC 50818 / BSB-021) TaxID=946362 RepID=F2U0T8_SALR5|nr:uncharacterized protein PTSG_01103 [Salpingoeca rosetta]EGD80512.1 hypothetical protein PTSG_01103 [Salpingoeca rosetta]|eukprot:XP_004997073.1 hypothetical protein PTSG_01103 [Salpingoeca rosetta]
MADNNKTTKNSQDDDGERGRCDKLARKLVKALVEVKGVEGAEQRLSELLAQVRAEKKSKRKQSKEEEQSDRRKEKSKKKKKEKSKKREEEDAGTKAKEEDKPQPDSDSAMSEKANSKKKSKKEDKKKRANSSKEEKTADDGSASEENTRKKAKQAPAASGNDDAGYWQQANLGSDARKSKFLRLMGAGKKKDAAAASTRNVDVNKGSAINQQLEQQFERARQMQHRRGGGRTGFSS